MDPIRKLGMALPPALDIIEAQSGYQLPEWLVRKQGAAAGAPTPLSVAAVPLTVTELK